MPRVRSTLLSASLAVLVACGGGKSKSTPIATTHRVSGTVTAAASTEVDWDVADVSSVAAGLRRSNDDAAHAQPLPSAVTVGGWVALTTSTFYDPVDVYRVALAQGQRLSLVVADAASADV